jgi:hypothetical protein
MSVLWLAFAIVVTQRVDYFFPSLSSCYLLFSGASQPYDFPLSSDKWNTADIVHWCHEFLAIKAMAITIFILRACHRHKLIPHNNLNLKTPLYSLPPSLDLLARPRVIRIGQSADGKPSLVQVCQGGPE